MGNLSNRVMNMKFMRKADTENEAIEQEEEQKKIKDMSEWVLPNSSKIIAKNKPSNIVQSVGYVSINSFAGEDKDEVEIQEIPANVGRRTWGEPEPKSKKEEPDLNITRLKDSIPEQEEKPLKKGNKGKGQNASKVVEESPEMNTNEFLDSLWKKSNTPSTSNSGSKKRKPENKEEYVPDIKNKKKRFTKPN